ncbi:MAG: hypothetical protein ACW99Q_04135, partial [Candidatus Kariarchaeaceae archaeon]
MPTQVPSQPPVSIQPEPNQNSANSSSSSGGLPGLGTQPPSLELQNQGILGYQASNNLESRIPEPPIGQNIDNADANQQRTLTNVGINALRPEIVATTEFVPLANDDNQFVTNSNYTLNFGDNYQIEATGLTRLLEKQLILQQTVSKNVQKFISIAAGFDIDEFLRTVKQAIAGEDIPLGDIQNMKNIIVTKLQNLDVSNVANTIQEVTPTGTAGLSAGMNPNQIRQASRAEIVEQRQDFQNLKKIVDLFDSPYADLAFEYVARDIFISKSIEFIDGLISLKLKLERSLDIGNCDVQNNLEINDQLIRFISEKSDLGSSGEKPIVDFTSFKNYYIRFVAERSEVNSDAESLILNQGGTKKLLTILRSLSANILFQRKYGNSQFNPLLNSVSSSPPTIEDLTNPNVIPAFSTNLDLLEFDKIKQLDAVNLYFTEERGSTPYGARSGFEPSFTMPIQEKPETDRGDLINFFVYSLSDMVYANNFKGKDDFESASIINGFDTTAFNDQNINLSS